VDLLAKAALMSGLEGGLIMEEDFPFEPVRFKLSENRVSGSPRQALEADWGFRAARSLFAEKNIIQERDFYLVWWEGLQLAMSKYPKM
jgi:hypothetical protein